MDSDDIEYQPVFNGFGQLYGRPYAVELPYFVNLRIWEFCCGENRLDAHEPMLREALSVLRRRKGTGEFRLHMGSQAARDNISRINDRDFDPYSILDAWLDKIDRQGEGSTQEKLF